MRDDRITDIEIGGRKWTHDDWEANTPRTLSEIASALMNVQSPGDSYGSGMLVGEPLPELRGAAYNIPAIPVSGHAPFPTRALRSEPGVAPLLEFPD